MSLVTHGKKSNDILRNQETNQVKYTNNVTEIKDNQTQAIQVRSFRPHLLNPETEKTENRIIGLSIISRTNQNDLPRDLVIHAYPGSTTDEKDGILDSYENKQPRTITLQDRKDRTNSLLKPRSIKVK